MPKPARERWLWISISGGVVLVMLLALLLPRERRDPSRDGTAAARPRTDEGSSEAAVEGRNFRRAGAGMRTAEEIVAAKLRQFAENRRQIVYAMARHFGVDVPEDVERFFEAAAAGNWEEMEALFKLLRERQHSDARPRNLEVLWPAIMETFGVTQEARLWPAQKLLDYGDAILSTLRPGMVYVGGTDPGRFIPTLMTETQGGDRHIVVTQNALADGTYLEYLGFLYGDRCSTLTKDDSERAFADYMKDAERRLKHDRDFPNEPKQVRPGEDIQTIDGKVQVSGQIAVMSINERLIRMLMEKNPDLSFAIEQSFPFKSLYDTTTPLGPIMELGVRDEQYTLTRDQVAESVNYWRTTAQEFASNPETANSAAARMAYGKMAAEQAALLLHHQHTPQAEEAYRLATQIGPGSPEAVFGYVNLLIQQNRIAEAMPIAETALKTGNTHQQQFQALAQELQRLAQQ